jgi:hypothetical protein
MEQKENIDKISSFHEEYLKSINFKESEGMTS